MSDTMTIDQSSDADEFGIVIRDEDAMAIFTAPDAAKLAPFVELVAAEAEKFAGSVATAKGRKDIASFAAKIRKVKTYIEGQGKAMADIAKEVPKVIDANRKFARDRLDALVEQVREPLTAWETAEKARVAGHEAALDLVNAMRVIPFDASADDLRTRLASLDKLAARDWEDYADIAKLQLITTRQELEAGIASAEQRAKERAELEAVRAELEERKRQEEVARLAEDKVRLANERAALAEQQAKEFAQNAVIAERERQAREAQAAREEELRRAKDRAHAAAINNAILAALTDLGLEAPLAKKLIKAMALGKIPYTQILY